MKKTNSFLIEIILLTIMLILMITPTVIYANNTILLGDIDGNNRIDSSDLLRLLKHIIAMENNNNPDWILKDNAYIAADINQDEKVNTGDMLIILRYIAATSNEEIRNKHPEWCNKKIVDIDTEPISSPNLTPEIIKATGIKLDKTEIELEKEKEIELIATVQPNNATEKEIEFEVTNNEIAKIEEKENGKLTITGLKAGETKVTAKVENKIAACKVVVKEPEPTPSPNPEPEPTPTPETTPSPNPEPEPTPTPETTPSPNPEPEIIEVKEIKLDKTEIELEEKKETELIATIQPDNATNKEIKFEIENNEIAKIEEKENGKLIITGLKAGETTITAKAGEKAITCKITIKAKQIELEPELKATDFNLTYNKKVVSDLILDLTRTKIATLGIQLEPSNAKGEVQLKIANTKIAKLENRKVTALKNGETTITATMQGTDGKTITKKCKVKVQTTGILIKKGKSEVKSNIMLEKGDKNKKTVTLTVTPTINTGTKTISSNEFKKITWTTTNTSIIGISTSNKGKTAKITAQKERYSKSYSKN